MSLERFRKVYSLLPDSERKMVIVIIDERTFTWEEAYKEIKDGSELGERVQKGLEDLDLI